MKNIANIVGKEVRELLTLRLLAPFIAVLAVMLVVGRAIRGERTKAGLPQRIMVVLHDTSSAAHDIVASLTTDLWLQEQQTADSSLHFACDTTSESTDIAIRRAQRQGISTVIVLPAGIGRRLTNFDSAEVEVYSILRSFSATTAMRELKVKDLLTQLNRRLVADRVRSRFPEFDPRNFTAPLRLRQFTVIRDRIAAGDPAVLTGIIVSQMFMVPMVLLMIIIYVSQMIAASIGQEKENKTLETLLTVPVSRISIVVGKMLGAVAVALVTTAIFFLAFSYYAGAFNQLGADRTSTRGIEMVGKLNLTLSPVAILVVATTLLLGIICALSLATLLAVFAEDARSAQAIIAPVMVLCLLPYFLTLFFDVETLSLPLKLLIYAIPFSYPFMAPKAALFHEYGTVLWGCLYMAAFAAGAMFIAGRIFTTDRVLTAKLRFRPR